MYIYLASSWKNQWIAEVLAALERAQHKVYDFRTPTPCHIPFTWDQVDPEWELWDPHAFSTALAHPLAKAAFASNMNAIRSCDALVAVAPFGSSTSLELGYAVGAQKITIVMLATARPELMIKMCDHLCVGITQMLDVLGKYPNPPPLSFRTP